MTGLPRRVAFVIPRYGAEVVGGAEHHCREVAERLASDIDVEVFTSTALDYERWANHYPIGMSVLNGVTVRRFPVTIERDPEAFATFSQRALGQRHGALNELQWLLLQGPCVPDLLTSIADERENFDLFVFWIYLYFPTYFGLPLLADKAVFVPLAHDEAPFHLDIFRPLFYLPRWIVYNSPAERALIDWKFGPAVAPGEVIGPGVTPPRPGDPDRFRQRFGIADPFVVYIGRVTPAKGCDELFELFAIYKRFRPDGLKLVVIGQVQMEVPARADIRALGFVGEQDKADALAAAAFSVTASRSESFSMSIVESLAAGTPALVNAECLPLREHVLASGGGLLYEDRATFCAAMERLSSDALLRASMATSAKKYASGQYRWDAVASGWIAALAEAMARVARTSSLRNVIDTA